MPHQKPGVREVTREELVRMRQQGEPFILVNVLPHEEFAHVHIPGSINVPLLVLRELAPLLFGEHDTLIMYCSREECTASPTAVKILLQMGFTDVADYHGGMQDWIDAGLPVVHHAMPPPDESAA
ncbi:MAG: rhodanese-like domain-containing protein [Armatimonadota bacterium]